MRSPTPHSDVTGSECRNGTVAARGTSRTPSGLAMPEPSFATNFVAAMPTEQVTSHSARTRSRIRAAMCVGGPSLRRAPETSRKASSILTCSTRTVTSRSTAMTPSDTSW